MKTQKAISHLRGSTSLLSKFSYSLQANWLLEIYCTAIQFINLYSLELAILLWANCCPSSDAFLDLQASWAHKATWSLAHMQNLVIPSSRIMAAQHDTASGPSGWHSSKILTPHICSGAQEGLSWPLTFDWLLPSWQRLTSIQKLRKIPNYVVPGEETAPETLHSFSGLPLKSWLLWSSPLLLIHKQTDRRFCSLLSSKTSTPLQSNTKIEPLTVTAT